MANQLWTSPVIRRETTVIQVTPMAQGLRGMRKMPHRLSCPLQSGSLLCASPLSNNSSSSTCRQIRHMSAARFGLGVSDASKVLLHLSWL